MARQWKGAAQLARLLSFSSFLIADDLTALHEYSLLLK